MRDPSGDQARRGRRHQAAGNLPLLSRRDLHHPDVVLPVIAPVRVVGDAGPVGRERGLTGTLVAGEDALPAERQGLIRDVRSGRFARGKERQDGHKCQDGREREEGRERAPGEDGSDTRGRANSRLGSKLRRRSRLHRRSGLGGRTGSRRRSHCHCRSPVRIAGLPGWLRRAGSLQYGPRQRLGIRRAGAREAALPARSPVAPEPNRIRIHPYTPPPGESDERARHGREPGQQFRLPGVRAFRPLRPPAHAGACRRQRQELEDQLQDRPRIVRRWTQTRLPVGRRFKISPRPSRPTLRVYARTTSQSQRVLSLKS